MKESKLVNKTSFFDCEDRTRSLFYQTTYSQNENIKAQLLITHGLGEHSDAYKTLTAFLCTRLPIKVISWDLCGHGKSSGQRGYVGDICWFVDDYKLLLKQLQPSLPLFTLSHSLGGLIQNTVEQKTMALKDFDHKASIYSNPCFGLEVKPPEWKKKGANILKTIAPRLTLDSEIKPEQLSKDPVYLEAFKKDHYRHTKVSSRLFLGMIDLLSEVTPFPEARQSEVLALLSKHDLICSYQKSLDIFSDCRVVTYNDSLHEIFNDIEKEDAFHKVLEFIDERL